MKDDIITMAHGAGGRKMRKFIADVIGKYFSNPVLDKMEDGAVLPGIAEKLVFTTDSFVVTPLFFPGGDIGRLAVCGTINDLAAMGAMPLYMTVSLILEEGSLISDLEKVIASIKKTAAEARVMIVAGDTKVVGNGKADKIFINTAGIGKIYGGKKRISSASGAGKEMR